MWVAVGQDPTNAILTSTDGLIWSGVAGISSITTHANSVAWNGSRWVVTGQGTNTILTSTDGVTWTPVANQTLIQIGNGVTWNGDRWTVVGQGTNTIVTSTDGIAWIPVTGTTFAVAGLGVTSNNIWASTPGNSQIALNRLLQNYFLRFGHI